MKLNCLIVDDEPLALDLLESYILKTPFLNLAGRCTSAFRAIEILEKVKTDLLFLDIQMPGLTGLEFSRTIQGNTKIIFTTAFRQYALEGFQVNAIDYLLKPISYEEFLKSAMKAKEWFSLSHAKSQAEESSDSIFVKSDYKLIQIPLNDILYIEGLKDYAKIYINSQEKPVMTLMSMKLLEEKLPADKFHRVHRSFIVQLDKIKVIERNHIVFGKTFIPVSEKYKDKFLEFINTRFFQ